MNKKARIILMTLSIITLVLIGWNIEGNFSFITNQFWFAAGAVFLVILSLVDQPHFSKDSNVFVNGTTAFVSLLLITTENRDFVFWTFFAISLYLIISSYYLMWNRKEPLRDEKDIIKLVSRLNRLIGKPDVIFSAFLLWGGIKQYGASSGEFNAILWFWIIYTILNYPMISNFVSSFFDNFNKDNNKKPLAKIVAIQSENVYLAESQTFDQGLNIFEDILFKTASSKKIKVGKIIDKYTLNDIICYKILEIDEISNDIIEYKENQIYKMEEDLLSDISSKKFVGIVTENSDINKLNFFYSPQYNLKSGDLVKSL
jgi:hypothetical protein